MADIREIVLCSCQQFMVPIARMLLRYGVGFREFAEVCKAAFVQVASDDYGIRGRKTNMSRVAIMTGLTRKEVKRVREARDVGTNTDFEQINRPSRVLMLWHQSTDYLGEDGLPLDLPFDGSRISFVELTQRAGGDLPPRAMLRELIRVGSVTRLENGFLRVNSQSFNPKGLDPLAISQATLVIHDLCTTVTLNSNPDRETAGRFQRVAYSSALSRDAIPRFHRIVREHGMDFLRLVDEWIAAHEADSDTKDSPSPGLRAGVGIFFFQDDG